MGGVGVLPGVGGGRTSIRSSDPQHGLSLLMAYQDYNSFFCKKFISFDSLSVNRKLQRVIFPIIYLLFVKCLKIFTQIFENPALLSGFSIPIFIPILDIPNESPQAKKLELIRNLSPKLNLLYES